MIMSFCPLFHQPRIIEKLLYSLDSGRRIGLQVGVDKECGGELTLGCDRRGSGKWARGDI